MSQSKGKPWAVFVRAKVLQAREELFVPFKQFLETALQSELEQHLSDEELQTIPNLKKGSKQNG